MKKVLVLFAHPNFEASRANRVLVDQIKDLEDLTFHDLYDRYPDFNIDITFEKELLANHEVLIWHHPFYWYSCPPLMKQWIDLVLEFGWAYGPNGNALKSKKCMNVITAGGTREVYCSEGSNMYSVGEFLKPFEQTARLCGMHYLPPFAVMGTHKLTASDLADHGKQYARLVRLLQDGSTIGTNGKTHFINDVPELIKPDDA